MSQKIARKDLERYVELLAEETGVPLALETWSPGDGWTRYTLTTDGGSARMSHSMTKGACWDALTLALKLTREMRDRARPLRLSATA